MFFQPVLLPHGPNGKTILAKKKKVFISRLNYSNMNIDQMFHKSGGAGMADVRRFSVSFLVCFHVEVTWPFYLAGFSLGGSNSWHDRLWAAGKMDGSVLLARQHFQKTDRFNSLRESRWNVCSYWLRLIRGTLWWLGTQIDLRVQGTHR